MTIATLIEKFQEDISWLGYNATEREIIEHIKCAITLLKEQEEEIENLKQTAQSMMEGICLMKEREAQRDYEASVEMAEYCERYEQTYNPEDGSM